MTTTQMITKCACADLQCHGRQEHDVEAVQVLYRVDMDDLTGTAMCKPCIDDALDSGLFAFESSIQSLLLGY